MPSMLKLYKVLPGMCRLCLLFLLFLLAGCRGPVRLQPGEGSDSSGKKMEKINEFLVVKDEEVIRNFIDRMGWKMERSGTGLWYMIMERGDGRPVTKDATVTFDYIVSLLDGTVCYSSSEDGQKTIRLGYSGLETGLEEGMLLLREGDHARFILPPHLAHGLIGDGERIPARSTLVYEVWIRKVGSS